MSESKENAKQIVDVAHPGKTAPPLTSKPVIVTNRAILKDPMVVDESAKTEETAKPDAAKPVALKAPIASDIVAEEPKQTDKDDVKQEKVLEPTSASVKPSEEPPAEAVTEPQPTPKSESNEQPSLTSTEQDDDVGNGATITDAQIEAEAAAEKARDTQVQKLIDSKKYYVPVNAVEKRRAKRVTALGVLLSIVLVLIWVDIALDAGLIQLGPVKSVTHFFSN